MSDREKSRLVYSTDRLVARKEKAGRKETSENSAKGPLITLIAPIVRLEKKGRAGKAVTVISGLPLPADALDALLQELKKKLGTGGALKGMVMEVQGDRRDDICRFLEAKGFRPKRSG